MTDKTVPEPGNEGYADWREAIEWGGYLAEKKEADVERLRADNAALREIAQRVVALDYISYVPTTETFYECPWCGVSYDMEADMRAILRGAQQFSHLPNCVITKFHALLAKEPQP